MAGLLRSGDNENKGPPNPLLRLQGDAVFEFPSPPKTWWLSKIRDWRKALFCNEASSDSKPSDQLRGWKQCGSFLLEQGCPGSGDLLLRRSGLQPQPLHRVKVFVTSMKSSSLWTVSSSGFIPTCETGLSQNDGFKQKCEFPVYRVTDCSGGGRSAMFCHILTISRTLPTIFILLVWMISWRYILRRILLNQE